MNFTQNDRINQVTEKSIVVGVDIASEVHYARAFDWRGVELARVFRFENSLEGFESFSEWIGEVTSRNDKEKAKVGAEPTGYYWFGLASYLKESEIKLVLVNPFHVKRSKELDDNNPSKTDQKDPKTIAKIVIDGCYSEPYMPEGVYAELRTFSSIRQRISSIKNRIARWLKRGGSRQEKHRLQGMHAAARMERQMLIEDYENKSKQHEMVSKAI